MNEALIKKSLEITAGRQKFWLDAVNFERVGVYEYAYTILDAAIRGDADTLNQLDFDYYD